MNQYIQHVSSDKYQSFNSDWKFLRSEDYTYHDLLKENRPWKAVNLPHDWSIHLDFNQRSLGRSEAGLLDGGFGYYKKEFIVDESIANHQILIRFGGIYMDSDVWINGHFLGNYPFGYNEITYDLTDHLQYGKNLIVVKVSHRQPSSRWYSGSGIYRQVDLIVKNKLNIAENGLVIKTPDFDLAKNKEIESKLFIELKNHFDQPRAVKIYYTVYDQAGKIQFSATTKDQIAIGSSSSKTVTCSFSLTQPLLWSVDSPNLYYLHVQILLDNEPIDQQIIHFAYRRLDWDSQKGFYLNEQYMKLHGVCLHHDNGALGAIEDYASEKRKLLMLKEMGVNAVRTAHNPQSRNFINLCDELGLLVVEEIFDTWSGKAKKEFDYNRFFSRQASHPQAKGETWAEFDLKQMIRRDINAPSVIMWSLGNEIWETKEEYGYEIAKNLVRWAKEIDDTRYLTLGENAFNGQFKEGIETKIADLFDVVGLNYGEKNIQEIINKKPDWKFFGAETSSAVKSRGVYYDPANKDNIATGSADKVNRCYQMSDYGNDRVGWGETAIRSWIYDRDNRAYAGQFIWTGFDYIGEPTPWHNEENLGAPSTSSYFGIIDSAGLKKNDFYFYQSQWLDKTTNPMVKILPHWNFEDKKLLKSLGTDLKRDDNLIPVRVYSNLSQVDLHLNGKSLGKKSFNKKQNKDGFDYLEGASEDELYLEWLVPFEAGRLEAFASDDKLRATDSVQTARKKYAIRLKQEKGFERGISNFVIFEVIDQAGQVVPTANDLISFEIKGGEIIGVDNGNAASQEAYQKSKDGWQRRAFSGQGLVIIRPEENEVILYARNKDLVTACLSAPVYEAETSLLEKMKNRLTTNKLKQLKTKELINVKEMNLSRYDNLDLLLPEKILATDKDGYESFIDVEWESMVEDQALIKGKAGQLEAMIRIQAIDFVTAKNFSLATVKGMGPILPQTSWIYANSGEKKEVRIQKWHQIDAFNYLADLEGTKLQSRLKVRETIMTEDSYNYALAWNGSEIPAAFASYTSELVEGAHIMNLNNGVVSYGKDYRDLWSNYAEKTRRQDFAGILFGRGGVLEKHGITRVRLAFFEDDLHQLPKNFVLEYYTKDEVRLAKNYANLEDTSLLYDDENWKEIDAKARLVDDRFYEFSFKAIESFAIRIKMTDLEHAVGITEIECYGQFAKAKSTTELEIFIDGKRLKAFDDGQKKACLLVNQLPEIKVKTKNHASYSIIPAQKLGDICKIMVWDEANRKESIYEIKMGGPCD